MTYLSRRRCGALAAAALGAAALAGPAQAEVIGDSVPDNHNVTIFHNIDMVAVFGGAPGVETTIEVERDGVRIGHARGAAADIGEFDPPNNGGMEANHGPEGAPQPGDCWNAFTPDIMAGDVVSVSRAGDANVEEVRVDDIEIYGFAFEGLGGDILLQGHARLADGTPIPVAALDSGEIRQATPRYRANPTRVEETPGVVGGWTAVYEPPYTPFSEPTPLSQTQRREALLNNEHAMGYGHVAPPPRETQMSDGLEASGAALGCEGSPGQSNGVTGTDDAAINLTSGDLVVSGTSMTGGVDADGAVDPGTDITGATISATDGVTTITAPATGDFDGPGDWTATFARADLDTLADGPVRVSGSWDAGGTPIGGRALELDKDVVAPVLTVTPAPGEYTGATSVDLSAGADEVITYRNDGQPPSDTDAPYTGPIDLPFGDTVLSVRVRDVAGNVTDQILNYTVNRPPSPPVPDTGGGPTTQTTAPPAPAPIIAPPVQTPLVAPSLTPIALVASAKARSRVSLRSVRRRGLRAAFSVPSGTRFVLARLFRVRSGRRSLVGRKTLRVTGAGRKAVRFRNRRTRRLRAGRYVVILRIGRSRSSLGPATAMRFVVRR